MTGNENTKLKDNIWELESKILAEVELLPSPLDRQLLTSQTHKLFAYIHLLRNECKKKLEQNS